MEASMEEKQLIREALSGKTMLLPDGTRLPRLGQGTWKMAHESERREEEIRSLRLGVELGMTVVDTAESYGEGRVEELVGEALADQRDEIFLVSKVYPHNAGRKNIKRACEASLRRLKTDYLDLYLLHWRGRVPLVETVAGMEELKREGKIKRWGVSNFDVHDMEELLAIPDGKHCQINQVLYHLGSRGIEYDLLPWQEERSMPIMAYSPLAQGGALKRRLLHSPEVQAVAERHRATVPQILLAWCIRLENVLAIPKASSPEHNRDNAASARIELSPEDMALLDQAFPPPEKKKPLDIV